jgi:hypothetical protein
MNLLKFAFLMGVMFAVFGFLWGFVRLSITLLRPKHLERNIIEEYSIKALQYFFLIDVTFLFCMHQNQNNAEFILPYELYTGALILVIYFVGKLQNRQKRSTLFKASIGESMRFLTPMFNLKAEIGVILFGIGMFVFFIFQPQFAHNPISNWFYTSIIGIEEAPIIGFIFKIIGFFILLGILNKLINGIFFLISGKPLVTTHMHVNSENKVEDKNKFDDFEEL